MSRPRRTPPAASVDGLTDRERRFVEQYLIEPNGTQAAIKAGYSTNGAKVTASRLLTRANVLSELATRQAARAIRTDITADRVLKETELIAFSDVTHYVIDDHGQLKLTADAPEGATRAISKLKRKVTTRTFGKDTVTEHEVELAFWNKPEMLKVAGKTVPVEGFVDRVELTGKNGRALYPTPSELSDEELKAAIQALYEALP